MIACKIMEKTCCKLMDILNTIIAKDYISVLPDVSSSITILMGTQEYY